MLNIGIQFFGGRGGGGSGGARGSGRTGGGGADREIENTGFKNTGNGVYTFDTPYGGGQIERSEIPFVGTTYRAHAWNSDHDIYHDENTGVSGARQFSSLNAAKSWVKDAVKQSTPQSNPAAAAVGTRLSMGGYTYTKNSSGTWTTYKNGKRYPNRTNADIKRVFT